MKNKLNTSSLFSYSLSFLKLKYTLSLISLLGIFGVCIFASEVATGQINYSITKGTENVNINTINGKLDSSSKKNSDNNRYYNIHQFEGKAGEQIVIELNSKDFDAYLILRDSKDKNLAEDNNSGEENNARIVITLPSTGTYKIFATHKARKSGNYQLSWRAASPEDIELAEAARLNQQVLQLLQEGKYNEAIPLAEKALATRQKILVEHPHVVESLNNLAELYKNQGRYPEAEPLYKQSLQMIKRLLGKQHPNVANSLNNLAGLYINQERYSEAEPLYQQSLRIYKQNFGNEHPLVVNSLNNLAVLYTNQERYKEAEPLFKESLEIRKRLLGKEHPDVAVSLNNLASFYQNQGLYPQAEPLYQEFLEIIKRLLGKEHSYVAASLNNLAYLYQSQGR